MQLLPHMDPEGAGQLLAQELRPRQPPATAAGLAKVLGRAKVMRAGFQLTDLQRSEPQRGQPRLTAVASRSC